MDNDDLFDFLEESPSSKEPSEEEKKPDGGSVDPQLASSSEPSAANSEAAGSSSTPTPKPFYQPLAEIDLTKVENRQAVLHRGTEKKNLRNVNKRKREKTLAAICVDGATPITRVPVQMEPVDPICRRIDEFIKKRSRVSIRLRNKCDFERPNRTIVGVIVAADPHWNLYVSEASESYQAAEKVGVVQSYPDQMFRGTVYQRVPGHKRSLQRGLHSTIVMGHTIVHISVARS